MDSPPIQSPCTEQRSFQSSHSNDGDNDDDEFSDSFSYEHFPVVCPTCQGSGEIAHEAGRGMVHFVPVKDERLRPAWMKLKIITLMMVILIVGGTTTFFLFPRSISLNISSNDVSKFDFKHSNPWIEYSFGLKVVNDNFFPIRIKERRLELLYQRIIIKSEKANDEISVDSRSQKEYTVLLNATYEESAGKYINEQCYCSRDYVGQLVMLSVKLSYWLHDQTIQSNDNYFYIDCNKMVFPLHKKDGYICKPKLRHVGTSHAYDNATHTLSQYSNGDKREGDEEL